MYHFISRSLNALRRLFNEQMNIKETTFQQSFQFFILRAATAGKAPKA